MASTLTTWDFALKEWYTDDRVEDLCFSDNVFLGLLAKNEDFQGDGHPVPLIYGNPQGVAGTSLLTAQGNTGNVLGLKFLYTAGDYFGTVDIGDKVIKASRSNPGAYLENKRAEIDGLYRQMADALSIYSFGNGGHALGRENNVWTTGNAITLADPSDACNFEVNQHLVASTTDGSAAGTVKAGSTYVTAVDREGGIVTVNDITDITGTFAKQDYLFREGDYGNGTGAGIIFGLGAFITASSTSPPNLYGLVRTSDPQRLAGCRVPTTDTAGMGIEDRLKTLGSYMTGRYGGPGPTCVLMHPEDWQSLEIALNSRGIRPLKDDSTKFGYTALEAYIGGKQAKIYADRHCPKGTAFALKLDTWTMYSMLKMIHQLNGDGLEMLRKSTTNDYEFRLVSYPCLGTCAPGWNGRVAMP
jgi:hypothetical protein